MPLAPERLTRAARHPAVLVALAGAAGAIVALAPTERTLGGGIRAVYVHVALTWTGMSAMTLLGLWGLVMTAAPTRVRAASARRLGWVGVGFLSGGVATSFLAASINWGGVFWAEPRTEAMLRVISVALIAQVLAGWADSTRLRGALYAVPALLLTWSVLATPLVLHPENAARASPEPAIRATFLAAYVLSVMAAWWLVAYRRPLGQ